MNVTISPGIARGRISAPPSKSYAHRLILGAALSEDESVLRGIGDSQDILATLDCAAALGARFTRQGDTLRIRGSLRGFPDDTVFPCRESGSTLRFFLPTAMALGSSAVFTGSERLFQRGIGLYQEILPSKGVVLNVSASSIAASGRLQPGEFVLPGNVSSQYITGLLFALPLLKGDSIVRVLPPVESRPYLDVTLAVLRQFGVRVREIESNTFTVPGGQRYCGVDTTVEGDWSNSAALLAFNSCGGSVSVDGLNDASLQGDRVCLGMFAALEEGRARLDISDCPDLGPVLFAAAALHSGAEFIGTRRLRIKESDRAQAMAEELAKCGVRVRVEENAVHVYGGTFQRPQQPLSSHNDHRVVMALALLCSVYGGTVEGAEAVGKSYPDFFDALSRLGIDLAYDK